MINHVNYPTGVLTAFGKVLEKTVVADHHGVFISLVLRKFLEVKGTSDFTLLVFFGEATENVEGYRDLYVTGLGRGLHSFRVIFYGKIIKRHFKSYSFFKNN